MIIGIPREIKKNEYRVAATPYSVQELVRRGHKVLAESNAGAGSGFSDADYEREGAEILPDARSVYGRSEMIYKVKEILPGEYDLLREGMILLTYIHSNAHREQTDVLLARKVIGIAYEDIIDANGRFPLLKPMSELAGKGGFMAAVQYSQSINGGQGKMLCRINGVRTPEVTVIGAGNSGIGAAELAAQWGNKVTVLDINMNQLEYARSVLPPNVEFLYSDKNNIDLCIRRSDVLMNCILWPKTRKDHLVSREMLRTMKPDALIVDVACDEGGAVETCRATTHDDPIYREEGITHYCVDNIPSAFSQTASILLSGATLPYALEIAEKGCERALRDNIYLRRGLTCYLGELTLEETGLKQNRPYRSPEAVLSIQQAGLE